MPSTFRTLEDVNNPLKDCIKDFCLYNRLPLPQARPNATDHFSDALREANRIGARVLVTIDEYDRVARTVATFPESYATEMNGVLKGILGVLKDNQNANSLLMTGISTLHHTELTSTSNYIDTLSLDPSLATAAGFLKNDLQTELTCIFENLLHRDDLGELMQDPRARSRETMVEACLSFMEHYFNGYQFVPDAPKVFNPTQCLRFFKTLTKEPRVCMQRVWNTDSQNVTDSKVFDNHAKVRDVHCSVDRFLLFVLSARCIVQAQLCVCVCLFALTHYSSIL